MTLQTAMPYTKFGQVDDIIDLLDELSFQTPGNRLLRPKSPSQLLNEHPQLREIVVDGLLRRGELMNLIASPKTGKSWIVLHLAFCVATGAKLFGHYEVKRGRVLLLDNELHPETMAQRVVTVANAMGLAIQDHDQTLAIETLRAKPLQLDGLIESLREVAPGHYSLVILDAWYRAMPEGFDENSNSDMTKAYAMVDQIALHTNAALVLVHHTSKGSQAGKSVTDVGSGAGAQSRAADSHLIIRNHEVEGAVVIEAVARSFPPPGKIALRQNFPLWHLDTSLDPDKLSSPRSRTKAATSRDTASTTETWSPESFGQKFVTSNPERQDTIVANAAIEGLSMRKAHTFLRLLESKMVVYRWKVPGNNAVYFANLPQTLTSQ